MRGLFTVLFCVSLALSNSVVCQTISFENYSTKNGLLSDEIYNLHQDRKGFLWVFSKYGTVKFDGFRFKPVLSNLSFQESFVYCAYERADGRMWVANSKGHVFEVRHDSAIKVQSRGMSEAKQILQKRGDEIMHLIVDDSLNFYVLTKGYSFKVSNNNATSSLTNLADQISDDSVMYRIQSMAQGPFLYCSRRMADGLFYYNKRKRKFLVEYPRSGGTAKAGDENYEKSLIIHNTHPRAIKQVQGGYWFANSNSIVHIDSANNFSFFLLPSLVLNFTIDKEGHFWIACLNNGLFETDQQGHILHHYLGHTTVNDVKIDHRNGLWATTDGSGLFYCQNTRELSFAKDEPLGGNQVHLKLINQKIYASSNQGHLFEIDTTGKIIELCKGDSVEIWDFESHQGKILTTGIYGINVIQDGKRKMLRSTGYDVGFRKIISYKADTLVCFSRKVIAYLVSGKIDKAYYTDKRILDGHLQNDTFYIGTEQGVYTLPFRYQKKGRYKNGKIVYDTISLEQPGLLIKTKQSSVNKIFPGNPGELWFCSEGEGLFKRYGTVLETYNVRDGLPDNRVNYIFCFNQHNLLLSTNSGLYVTKYPRNSGGETKWVKLMTGFVSHAFFYRGKIYASTRQGLSVLETGTMDHGSMPLIGLRSVNVDSLKINPADFKAISSAQSGLSFELDVVDFERVKSEIHYKLLGPQQDSGVINGNRLRFGLLPVGDYTLRVYTHQLNSSENDIQIRFSVTPTFTQTLLFKILVFVTGVMLFLFGYRLLLQNRKKKEEAKILNEQLLAEYKLIALKAQVNPHFMSNCLSAIQDMVIRRDTEKATYYIAEFGLMMRQILEYSSKQTISLAEEFELLSIYVELEQLRFDNEFTFQLEVAKDINSKKIQVPPLILNPLVENAIWHGLLPIKEQRPAILRVSAALTNDQLLLTIEDNGRGLEREIISITNLESSSYGIQITEQRLSNWNYLHGGDQAALHFENLSDSNPRTSGVRVNIYLPIVQ